MLRRFSLAFATLALAWTSPVAAQDRPPASFVSDVVKGVLFDPTTYAPAMLMYGSAHLDWESSQVFFQQGFTERNARYTISGVSNTAAMGRWAGNRQIATDSLGALLKLSVVHNTTERVIEGLLIRRYPNHQKILRAVGLAERIVGAAYLSMALSRRHIGQWQQNELLARQLGYK
jgi:hypothetical protein